MRLCLGLLAGVFCAAPVAAQPVEKIADGFRFTEGPAWSRDGFLVFSDIPANRLLKFVPGAGVTVYREASGGTNGNTYDREGRLYSCQGHERRVVRMAKDGAATVLAERFEGKRLNSPNDLVVRRDGHVYFTDPAFGRRFERDLDFHGVYHIAPDGRIEAIARPATRPNGIALSPDGRILYVADSDARLIRAYDLDAAGSAANERIVVSAIEGVPDGLRADEQGNLYLAAKQIYVFTPAGRPLRSIEIPQTPANLAFGGSDLATLYVTARSALYRVHVGIKGSLQY